MKTYIILSCVAVVCLSLPPFPLFNRKMMTDMLRRAEETISKRTSVEISKTTFDMIDVGGDGHIDADDYATFVKANYPQVADVTYNEIKQVFMKHLYRIDLDGNGKVELNEFLAVLDNE